MPLLPRIFLVSVKSKCADVESVYTPVRQDASDIIRHILKIPFVDKPVDLPGFFVALIRGVGIVNNADKADAPNREQAVNVLLYKLQFACKTRLRFAENNIKLALFCVGKQSVKFRTLTVRPRVIIVAVNVV